MKLKLFLLISFIMGYQFVFSQIVMNIHMNDGTVIQVPLNDIDSVTFTNLGNPNNPVLATLTTSPITGISDTAAFSGGVISNDGGATVTQRGVCYSTTANPTINDFITQDGSGTGSFVSHLTNLSHSTTYYVRAYAINSAGVAYGNEETFTTLLPLFYTDGAGVTFNGEFYPSIIINGQEWMAKNLVTTKYANGDPITEIQDDNSWANASSGAWCNYNNMPPASALDSGKYYNWFAVNDSRNVCPTGWHVPTSAEWVLLYNFLGGNSYGVAGNQMKIADNTVWNDSYHVPTNQAGFSAWPSGMRNEAGYFQNINYRAYWWSATEYQPPSIYANLYSIQNSDGYVVESDLSKNTGVTVRCIKD